MDEIQRRAEQADLHAQSLVHHASIKDGEEQEQFIHAYIQARREYHAWTLLIHATHDPASSLFPITFSPEFNTTL